MKAVVATCWINSIKKWREMEGSLGKGDGDVSKHAAEKADNLISWILSALTYTVQATGSLCT